MEIFLTLDNAKLKKEYKIVNLCKNIDISTKTRLYELGFLPNHNVKVVSKSISQGVLLVEINSVILSIRKNEASCVVVK